MDEIEQLRPALQETANFMGAMASGIEHLVGRPANAMAYVAGKSLGRRFSKGAKRTNDVVEALEEVRRVLVENNCLWHFETFSPKSRSEVVSTDEDGNQEVLLVFRDCMIRQSLFRFGHHQQGSLCNMMYGFFAGALESIMGSKSQLEIQHAGENACLKRLIVKA